MDSMCTVGHAGLVYRIHAAGLRRPTAIWIKILMATIQIRTEAQEIGIGVYGLDKFCITFIEPITFRHGKGFGE